MEVRLSLRYGGDPLSHAVPEINEETPMEDICPNCLDFRHHSCRPWQKKESPSGSDRVAPLSSNNSKKESPREPYRDALKKGTFQSRGTLKTPNHSPQLVTLMPKKKTLVRSNSSPTATSAGLRKGYEQRKEEYAQARLRILGSSERTKESPKGS